jgi:hypothetical protein
VAARWDNGALEFGGPALSQPWDLLIHLTISHKASNMITILALMGLALECFSGG